MDFNPLIKEDFFTNIFITWFKNEHNNIKKSHIVLGNLDIEDAK